MMARIALHRSLLTTPLAHRGYHDRAKHRQENSLSAFQAAIEAGYGIELDVQLTADGQAVVFHDETLDRMVGRKGAVVGHTAAELGAMRLVDSDDLIPTLRQVLDLVAGKVPLLIEIKDQFDTVGKLEDATAKALVGYDGPVAVMSFNPQCMAEMAKLAPNIARGLTTDRFDYGDWAPLPHDVCDRLREIPDYDATQSSFISHSAKDLAYPRVAELKANGAAILCWTIRSPEAEANARQIADNITFEGYPAPLRA
jgi:glycerophosphoryl diester phosphodiesterase